MLKRFGIGVCIILAGLVLGCQAGSKPPPTLEAPAVKIGIRQYAGSALSGPTARVPDEAALRQARVVRARWFAVRDLPADGFDRLSLQARLIIGASPDAATAATSGLASSVIAREVPTDFAIDSLLGDDTRRVEFASTDGAVAPGTTLELSFAGVSSDVLLCVSRSSSDGWQLAVVRADRVPVAEQAPLDADLIVPPPVKIRSTTEREILLVDRNTPLEGARLVLAGAVKFEGSEAKGVVVDLTFGPTADDDAISALRAASTAQADQLTQQTKVGGGSHDLALSSGLGALAQAGDIPRGALAYLARESGAKLAESLVLVADDAFLQLLAKSVIERAPKLERRDRASIAWLLDRASIATLAAMSADAAHPISPSVLGVLASGAGEAGRQIDVLQSLASQSGSSEELENRVIAENMVFLEDNSPAARVRAYDWLLQRARAPQGYDPLAGARQRRAALEKAASTTQPAEHP